MNQHTPGPWNNQDILTDNLIITAQSGDIDIAQIYVEDDNFSEAWENARLIAAAPDLLAALRNLAEYCTSGRRYESQNPYSVAEIKAALNAVSQATGTPKWDEIEVSA